MRESVSDSKVRCSTRGNEIVTYPVNTLLCSPLDLFEMSCHLFRSPLDLFETSGADLFETESGGPRDGEPLDNAAASSSRVR